MHRTLNKTCDSCDTWNVPPKNQHKAKHSNQSEQKPSIDGQACPRSFATQALPINLPSMRDAPMPKPLVGSVEKDSCIERRVPYYHRETNFLPNKTCQIKSRNKAHTKATA